MDLKSLKEKKAMISEASVMENLLQKLPLEIQIEDLENSTQSNLEKISTICKIVKPHSVESFTNASVRAAEVDLEYRKLKKLHQLRKTEVEIGDLKESIASLPAIQAETEHLLSEHEAKNRQLENDSKIFMDASSHDASFRIESSAVHIEAAATLVKEFNEARNLQFENAALEQRLQSIPIKPGFDFSKENLQCLLRQKLLKLEDLKRQVFDYTVD